MFRGHQVAGGEGQQLNRPWISSSHCLELGDMAYPHRRTRFEAPDPASANLVWVGHAFHEAG